MASILLTLLGLLLLLAGDSPRARHQPT